MMMMIGGLFNLILIRPWTCGDPGSENNSFVREVGTFCTLPSTVMVHDSFGFPAQASVPIAASSLARVGGVTAD